MQAINSSPQCRVIQPPLAGTIESAPLRISAAVTLGTSSLARPWNDGRTTPISRVVQEQQPATPSRRKQPASMRYEIVLRNRGEKRLWGHQTCKLLYYISHF